MNMLRREQPFSARKTEQETAPLNPVSSMLLATQERSLQHLEAIAQGDHRDASAAASMLEQEKATYDLHRLLLEHAMEGLTDADIATVQSELTMLRDRARNNQPIVIETDKSGVSLSDATTGVLDVLGMFGLSSHLIREMDVRSNNISSRPILSPMDSVLLAGATDDELDRQIRSQHRGQDSGGPLAMARGHLADLAERYPPMRERAALTTAEGIELDTQEFLDAHSDLTFLNAVYAQYERVNTHESLNAANDMKDWIEKKTDFEFDASKKQFVEKEQSAQAA